jgi:uncharacterized protein (TIGR00369 family)
MDGHITPDAFNAMIHRDSPLAAWLGLRVEEIGDGRARMRAPFRQDLLRPGGVVNGPVIMALADYAMYAAVIGIGPDGTQSVTTNMNTHFLRKTTGKDLVAEARALRAGRSQVVLDVLIRAEGEEAPVAHVSGTYAYAATGRPQ